MKRSGDKQEPCGTPDQIDFNEDWVLFILTSCLRFEMSSINRLHSLFDTPSVPSFLYSISWFTLSNAFDRSIVMMSIGALLSSNLYVLP